MVLMGVKNMLWKSLCKSRNEYYDKFYVFFIKFDA